MLTPTERRDTEWCRTQLQTILERLPRRPGFQGCRRELFALEHALAGLLAEDAPPAETREVIDSEFGDDGQIVYLSPAHDAEGIDALPRRRAVGQALVSVLTDTTDALPPRQRAQACQVRRALVGELSSGHTANAKIPAPSRHEWEC